MPIEPHKITFPIIEWGTSNCFTNPRDIALARGWHYSEQYDGTACVKVEGDGTFLSSHSIADAWDCAFEHRAGNAREYAGHHMYFDREMLVSMIAQCHDAQDLESMQFYVNMLRDLLAFSLD